MTPFVIACALSGKGIKPKFEDFLPKFGESSGTSAKPKKTPQQMAAIFRMFANAQNAAMKAKAKKKSNG